MKMLTRIFHTKSIAACGRLINTALDSACDLDRMDHTAAASHFDSLAPARLALSGLPAAVYPTVSRQVVLSFRLLFISLVRRFATIQYEILGLREPLFGT